MNKKMNHWANIGLAVLVLSLSACGGNSGNSNPSGIGSGITNNGYTCGAGEERLNNTCVPANIDFSLKCASAGGRLINQDVCMNEYPVDILGGGFMSTLPPLLTPNNRTNPQTQVTWFGRPLVVRASDRLNYLGSGTYGKYAFCNARNFNGTNTGGSTQNFNQGFKEGYVASDGSNLYHLGDNRTQIATVVYLNAPGTLYVGLNSGYGECAVVNAPVKIKLDQCTNRSMQAVQCQ